MYGEDTQTDKRVCPCYYVDMAKKLSQQQQRRIQSLQQKQYTEASNAEAMLLTPVYAGLLIMRHGRQAWVETTTGEMMMCHCRPQLTDLVAGDRVFLQSDLVGGGVIVAVQPRSSAFYKTIAGQGKALAANVTCLVIVFATEPLPSPMLIDKYLLAAAHLGIKPLLLSHKADLRGTQDQIATLNALYMRLGYELWETCLEDAACIVALKTLLQDETSVFVGQSGVGKSSLIQCLVPDDDVRVGDISVLSKLGKHTTSNARLYHLPSGGHLIDSAGVRDLAIGDLSSWEIERGFIECRPLIGGCHFRDCQHQHEPNCAFKEAVASGALHASRFASLMHFLGRTMETQREK